MAVTAYKFPTTNGAYFNTWTNPGNAHADDGVYATRLSDQDQVTSRQSYETFGFSIPAGSTIDGIEVEVQGYVASPSGSPTLGFWVRKSGSFIGYHATAVLTGVEGTYTLGSSTDLWEGTGWVVSDFSDANFSVFWTVSNNSYGTYTFDYNKVRVYYTAPTLASVKTVNGLAIASNKTLIGLAKASTKSFNGVT